MLAETDGLSVCRDLRDSGLLMPILMLSARGEPKERVLGLDAGADDYIVKPFELDELLARVRAFLRRSHGFSSLRCGPLEIRRDGQRALVHGLPIDLTRMEYGLLLHLVHHVDQTVTREDLLAHVWQTSFTAGSNLVEVHISRVREKLGDSAWMLETVRGAGYRLRSGKPC
jgi:DNA-binding response OmpR family regulator